MDTVTASQELNLDWTFQDGDTRIMKLPNPKNANELAPDIKDLVAYAVSNNILLGDKYGADVATIQSAYIVEQTSTKLDIKSNLGV